MSRFLLAFGIAFIAGLGPGVAQTVEESIIPAPALEVDFTDLKSPDVILGMMEEAEAELAQNGCSDAVTMFAAVSIQSNATSNVIRAGLEPFYNSSRDDREAFARNRADLAPLIENETKVNDMIRLRNEAWVRQGICLLELGNTSEGISILNQALDRLSVDQKERAVWLEARGAMWGLVGIE